MLRTDDLAGAVWIPGDGKANPADLRSRWPRARATAACESVEERRGDRRATENGARRRARDGRAHDAGRRALRDRSSTAPASGRAQFGALAGVNVPLYSAEHFYIVTGRSTACIRCCR